ncbi:nucleoside-diphosphate kinase [Candidatus Daviesbacteria bacterium]|nr:nucleoside-diphosphate kinase [Candidatus Daviesbacteria bacterium]
MIEQTLVLIKPDGVKRSLIGEIIKRYESASLIVVDLKLLRAEKDIVGQHYPEEDEYMISLGKKSAAAGDEVGDFKEHGRMIVRALREYITSGPIAAVVLEGDDAIARVRKITGYTDPKSADKGTIRGDLGEDSILEANREKRPVKNLIHASGTMEEAKREIKLWFPDA